MTVTVPTFTIVGHPNKGKSSIVSTLAQVDTIKISQRSGTTERADRYEFKVPESRVVLVDTPGFQRPYKALQWLKQHTKDASGRAKTIEQFVNSEECRKDFPDEVEILSPIVEGAAIIYVVDGSRPYGPEYEFEMEILRWAGRPSMALINPIENEDYVGQWRDALHQYFKSVKVFNPLTAEFEKQTELFSTFAHLDERWHGQLLKVNQGMLAMRQKQAEQCVGILEQLLVEACSFSVDQKTLNEAQAKALSARLKKQFEYGIKQREEDAFIKVLMVYQHHNSSVTLDGLKLPPDLFDIEQWYMWGLNKKQLIAAMALTGAMGGATLDALTAGGSLMLGSLGGGVIGAAGGLLASHKIANLKISGISTSGCTATYGPINNRNFPYVILGRFLFFHKQVCNLNHANRQAIEIATPDFQETINTLDKTARRELDSACAKLVKQTVPKDLKDILRKLMPGNGSSER